MNRGQRCCGTGRGRQLTIQGKVRDCAAGVMLARKTGGVNAKYQMAYWGNAMRAHLAYIKSEGLQEPKADVLGVVEMADAVLKAECDGKDCSLITG